MILPIYIPLTLPSPLGGEGRVRGNRCGQFGFIYIRTERGRQGELLTYGISLTAIF
jgi:hypothetical protein